MSFCAFHFKWFANFTVKLAKKSGCNNTMYYLDKIRQWTQLVATTWWSPEGRSWPWVYKKGATFLFPPETFSLFRFIDRYPLTDRWWILKYLCTLQIYSHCLLSHSMANSFQLVIQWGLFCFNLPSLLNYPGHGCSCISLQDQEHDFMGISWNFEALM